MTCELNNNKLIVKNQGVPSLHHDLNPFLEIKNNESEKIPRDNNDFNKELQLWALENLDVLNLKTIASKINSILENPMQNDASFAQSYKIRHPLKKSSMRRWIDELCFK